MSDLGYQLAVRDASGHGGSEDWYRLGCWLADRKLWGVAAGCFARVVGLEPGHYRAWSNLGWCRHQGGRSEAGSRDLLRAIALSQVEGTPRALMSQVMLQLGSVGEAVLQAREAVRLEPQIAVNRMALSFALAAAGEWGEAWREYENRAFYKLPEFTSRPYRWWRGERVDHLYIEAEQGAGDCIFALRWVSLAAEIAERVTLFVHQGLYSLVDGMCGLPGNVEVYPLPRPLPVVDAWCPMLSLPVALEKGEPFFPGDSYIDPGVLIGWDGHDKARPRRVAIAWAGNPTHEQSHHRDIPLAHLLLLSEIPGVRLHSVQIGNGQGQFAELGCYGLIEDRSPEITNFADTARVLAGMDLVISVDTAVAHLAGAMGVPCWVLVNRRGMDFRWPVQGEATGWYKSWRLFRRELGEDWAAVIGRVAVALRELGGGESGDFGVAGVGSEDAVGVRGSGSVVFAVG